MMDLQNAINHARLAKAINTQNMDVPANAALVALLAEVERLKKEHTWHQIDGELQENNHD